MTKPSGPSVRDLALQITKWANRSELLENMHPLDWVDLAEAYLALESRCTAQQQRIERLEAVVQRVKEVIAKGEDHPDCPLIDLGEALDALDEDAT